MSMVTAIQPCYDSFAAGLTVCQPEPVLRKVSIMDDAAFSNVVRAYSETIFAVAFRITKNRAVSEDIVQESFMKLWQNRTEIVFHNVGNWLCRVAFNISCNHLKREAAKNKIINSLCYGRQDVYATGGEECLLLKESEALFERALSRLSPQQKIVYRLSRGNDLTRHEIATHLNISPNTVKNHLAKAIQFLKDNIGSVSMVLIFLAIQILFSGNTSTNDQFSCLYYKNELQKSGKDSKHKIPLIYRNGIALP